MNIRPLGDHVVLEPMKEDEKTKGGILLPATMDKEKPEKATVVAIGPGKRLEDGKRQEMSVKVGDMVMFKKYSPDEFKVDDKEYLVISESDIIGIIE